VMHFRMSHFKSYDSYFIKYSAEIQDQNFADKARRTKQTLRISVSLFVYFNNCFTGVGII